jgi:hypothetical protein
MTRSIVAFLIHEDDGTTDDLSAIIEHVAVNYTVIDHEVRVDVGDHDELDGLLMGLSWAERALVESGKPLAQYQHMDETPCNDITNTAEHRFCFDHDRRVFLIESRRA